MAVFVTNSLPLHLWAFNNVYVDDIHKLTILARVYGLASGFRVVPRTHASSTSISTSRLRPHPFSLPAHVLFDISHIKLPPVIPDI